MFVKNAISNFSDREIVKAQSWNWNKIAKNQNESDHFSSQQITEIITVESPIHKECDVSVSCFYCCVCFCHPFVTIVQRKSNSSTNTSKHTVNENKGRVKRMKHKCDKASGLIETLRVSNKTAVVHCFFFSSSFVSFYSLQCTITFSTLCFILNVF